MINQYLEYTNLRVGDTSKVIGESIKEAIFLNCFGYCTYLYNHLLVNKLVELARSPIKKVYVLGFPQGDIHKIKNDLECVAYCDGDEFDVVIPLAEFHSKKYLRVSKVLNTVRTKTKGKILKVIIETIFLSDEIKYCEAVKMVEDIGADFVKTNTGVYAPRFRSLIEDIQKIQSWTSLPIKAAGGIKDYTLAQKLVDLGVKRIGTSNASNIIMGEQIGVINGTNGETK
jgi:deoxyribose-phosphate aldolase